MQIVWGDSTGAQFPPYHVFLKPLNEKWDATRASLAQLRNACLQPDPDFTDAVARLADRGHVLRNSLFDDCRPEDRALVSQPQHWFENLTGDPSNAVVVTVHADPIAPIPWGLLHERGAAGGGDPYEGFRAVRYQVAALYNGVGCTARRGGFLLVFGLSVGCFTATNRIL